MGARPGVSDRRGRPRGRDRLLLPLRPHAEHRRHDGLALCLPEGEMGADRVRGADGARAVLADVSGRAHAAGCGRVVRAGAGAGRGALSRVPDGADREKGHAVDPARRGGALRRVSALRLGAGPVRLARGQRGSCQHHAWSQKRVHHDGRAARLSDRVFCR